MSILKSNKNEVIKNYLPSKQDILQADTEQLKEYVKDFEPDFRYYMQKSDKYENLPFDGLWKEGEVELMIKLGAVKKCTNYLGKYNYLRFYPKQFNEYWIKKEICRTLAERRQYAQRKEEESKNSIKYEKEILLSDFSF